MKKLLFQCPNCGGNGCDICFDGMVEPDQLHSRHSIFMHCPMCDGELMAEHAHYRCKECGWRDSCCD